ncbi:2Fe-2S ferredoxin, partial [Mycobacterium sp. ITM-2017-0098]
MSALRRLATSAGKAWPFELLPRPAWARQYPTYRQASPAVIGAALARSRQRPSGNWYTIAASSAIT